MKFVFYDLKIVEKEKENMLVTSIFIFSHKVCNNCIISQSSSPLIESLKSQHSAVKVNHTVFDLITLRKIPFENIVGKRENAGTCHFLLFTKSFLPFKRKKKSCFSELLIGQSSANAFSLASL